MLGRPGARKAQNNGRAAAYLPPVTSTMVPVA